MLTNLKLGLVVLAFTQLVTAGFAENPILVNVRAVGNPDAGQVSMVVTGTCSGGIIANSADLGCTGKSGCSDPLDKKQGDAVSQSGSTVTFSLHVYDGQDRFRFKILPGAAFSCQGSIVLDGAQAPANNRTFSVGNPAAVLGHIATQLYFPGTDGNGNPGTILEIFGTKN